MTNPSETRDSELVAARGYYIASKVRHAERWRDLRSFERDPIISTWIDDGDDVDHADLWERCIAEASRAAALIFYAEPDETFKGAWVEIGAALANNVPVFAVGMDRELTIAGDGRITHCATMIEARKLAREAADTIDPLTSTGEAVAFATEAALEGLRNGEMQAVMPVRLADRYKRDVGPIYFLYVSPREGHVEVPVERSTADDLTYLLECVSAHADKFPVPTHMTALVARIRADLMIEEEIGA